MCGALAWFSFVLSCFVWECAGIETTVALVEPNGISKVSFTDSFSPGRDFPVDLSVCTKTICLLSLLKENDAVSSSPVLFRRSRKRVKTPAIFDHELPYKRVVEVVFKAGLCACTPDLLLCEESRLIAPLAILVFSHPFCDSWSLASKFAPLIKPILWSVQWSCITHGIPCCVHCLLAAHSTKRFCSLKVILTVFTSGLCIVLSLSSH